MGLRFALLALGWSAFAQGLPDGPDKDLVEAICTACHDSARIAAKQGSKADWQAKVLEMLQECPDVTESERNRIAEYLARNFPRRVNVNKASAKEIAAGLEISAQAAEAIVRRREEKGAIQGLEDLKKILGVEAAKVEAIKARVEF
ncbi:MAG TPA: helix-hairpin-helix domain-containing protein [Bryobacteraceae bacterium]|nr:helix-hairpin-helix domain-containing protein [Bryobacteraceae bacterium]